MGKIGLIIKREYLTRVRKRSFIIMTFLGPILMAAIGIVPVWLASVNESIRIVEVIDESGTIEYKLNSSDNIKFVYSKQPFKQAKNQLEKSDYYALVHIPSFKDADLIHLQRNIKIYAYSQVSLNVKVYIQNQIEKQLEREMLKAENVDQAIVERTESAINVQIPVIELADKKNKDTSTDVELSTALGAFSGILIYIFIFLFGAQVMRVVIEEKTNRIVEVIISSVRPFQLMIGKILAIAAVGLTQFFIWIILLVGISAMAMPMISGDIQTTQKVQGELQNMQGMQEMQGNLPTGDENQMAEEITAGIRQFDFSLIFYFIFYFLGGYLLYGSLFAAVGSAVDQESDAQQLIWPITIPLIIPMMLLGTILQQPDGSVAVFCSIFPFFSPVCMMVRLASIQVPWYEIVASMISLIVTFLIVIWLAGRIYRTGIFMYGKKPSIKEVIRWVFS
jgi:ABC-2 type transport system permease protein